MVLNSRTFVFIFLPVVFLLNTIFAAFGKKWSTLASNVLLFAASVVFYAWGDPKNVVLLLLVGAFCYLLAHCLVLLEKGGKLKLKKTVLILGIVVIFGVLCFYKFAAGLAGLFGATENSTLAAVTMPLGISFFSFSAVSYIVDVYKNKVACEKNPFYVFLYITFFGKLTAGPVVRYGDMAEALRFRRFDMEKTALGMRRFVFGLAKKMIIANNVALLCDSVFNSNLSELTLGAAWIGAISYMLQIYFDFSGYSDMAIGIGEIFGFSFAENFNYPYASFSVKDFWRRWHISVSLWFRDYLYIPLGGNRKGKFRTCLNKIIVFFCTGLWHGSNFTFVLWGLWHGLFLLLEEYIKFPSKKSAENNSKNGGFGKILRKICAYIYTMLVVCIGFVMFRSASVSNGLLFISKMFAGKANPSATLTIIQEVINPFIIFVFILGIFAAFPWKILVNKIFGKTESSKNVLLVLSFVFALVLLVLSALSLAASSYSPFIYSQF